MDISELRSVVGRISESVQEIRNSGISESALITLIQESCKRDHSRGPRYGQKPGKKIIKAVLDGMEGLEEYVFPTEDLEADAD